MRSAPVARCMPRSGAAVAGKFLDARSANLGLATTSPVAAPSLIWAKGWPQ